MNEKIIPLDEVCIDFVILLLLVMYYIGIADISKNYSCINKSKTNLQLPLYAPIDIQRTGS